jgi:hypothetical protein
MATNPVGGVLASEISRSCNSFAGADITAVIGQYEFAELQSINYSVTREKAPVYTLGTPDPRAYSRNKRGIGGTLIWINFDRHALLNLIQQAAGTFVADVDVVSSSCGTQAPRARAWAKQTAAFFTAIPAGRRASSTPTS